MKTTKILFNDWSYPVIEHPYALSANCLAIINDISSKYGMLPVYITGMGTSAAMIMGGIASILSVYGPHRPNIVMKLLRKPEDSTEQGMRFEDIPAKNPILIVDDHICYGRTMQRLADRLREKGLIDYVIGVYTMCYNNDNPVNIKSSEDVLTGAFPAITFWAY